MLSRIQPASTTRTHARASVTTLWQDRTSAVLRAEGEWDLANADLLAESLREHEQAGRRFLRLDVSDVTFADSAWLEVLFTAHRRMLSARGTLVLAGVTPRILRLISLARLDGALLTTGVSDLEVARPLNDHPAARRSGGVVRPFVRSA